MTRHPFIDLPRQADLDAATRRKRAREVTRLRMFCAAIAIGALIWGVIGWIMWRMVQ